ncbi:MAG: arsenate reductase ArsC [Sulfitobacter sp.]
MNILVLCTGNSARSILLESLLTHLSDRRVTSFSAGSQPAGQVNPHAIALLKKKGHETGGFRSKSWDEFGTKDAPQMDIVITVCGSAAAETCPMWPGTPLRAHWGVEDPAAARPEDAEAAFSVAFDILSRRATAFLAAPIETLDPAALQDHLKTCGALL